MQMQNITTTLPLELIEFLSEASGEMNVKKNKVIENALLFWKKKNGFSKKFVRVMQMLLVTSPGKNLRKKD